MAFARLLAFGAALTCAGSALALDQGDYRFNGFGTAGITHLGGEDDGRSFGINGQTNDHWRGDQLSKLGGQFQYGLTDKLDATVQVTAKAEQDQWKANLEWAYLAFHATDNLTFRAGRLRTPVFMYSETLDVGITYPWLRLPDEVYSQVQVSNYEGADALWSLPVAFGTLNLQVSGGQAVNRNYFVNDDLYDIDYKRIAAANVSLATNEYGTVRLAYTESSIDLHYPLLTLDDQKGKFTSLGYQYDNGTWLTSNEWTRRVIEGDNQGSSNAFYLMAGRRFGDFLAHVTYAQLDEERAGRQSSWTYGLNYNITPSLVLKSEYKRVDTTGGYNGTFVKTDNESIVNAVYDRSGGRFGAPARNFDGDIISIGLDFIF